MERPRREIPLGFTETRIPEGSHICYIFNDEQERRRTMSRYLQSGLEAGEKVLYLVDTMAPEEFVRCMSELGLDISAHRDRMVLKDALPAYCPDGRFSCPDMLALVGSFYNAAIDEGHAGARGTGEMSWSLVEGRARRGDLFEYEARLNDVCRQYPYTVCCQYDARRFDGETIMDVLAVHPMMIVRGRLLKNPFYQDPSEFLGQYRLRQGGPGHA